MTPRVLITVDAHASEDAIFHALQREVDGSVGMLLNRGPLELGDVMVERENGGGVLYIERKVSSDWVASIKDGRRKEQSQRWLRTREDGSDDKFVYLIEGGRVPMDKALNAPPRGMTGQQYNAAIIMSQVRDGFPVLDARDPSESAKKIVYLASKLAKNELGGAASEAAARKVVVGLDAKAHKRKRDNLDEPTALLAAMLGCVPGMSPAKAAKIVEAFPTVRALRKADAEDIAALRCESKRIGPALAVKVHDFFTSR